MFGNKFLSYAILLTSASTLWMTSPAAAHHSYAMFDTSKTLTLVGSVKEFQFTNPHVWLKLIVASDGAPVEWNIEGTSPNTLFRRGWLPKTLQAGDKISLELHPLRDGSNGGSLLSVTTASGQRLEAN